MRLDGRTLHASIKDGRISVYQAADLAPQRTLPRVSSLTVCFRPASCTSAITSFRRWSWSLCLAQLTPACGVASMPFRPGCHRPFHHSVVIRSYASAVIVVACFSIRLDFFIRFCHPLDIMLQHVLTSTVITLRPFTPYFNSWCLLLAIYYYTPLPWWFSGTHP